MAWKECDRMSLRTEFVNLAGLEGANVAEVCRRFGISRKTGHKWIRRFKAGGPRGLVDRSRRPLSSPRRTTSGLEAVVLSVRTEHPAWGGRKIRARLQALGHTSVPAASTITEILRRHRQLDPEESLKHRPMRRFERDAPNELWQMDFKGDFGLDDGRRCYPLTVLDDHSRYLLGLRACGNQRYGTVRDQLTGLFRVYGLPQVILADNGPPWAVQHGHGGGYTRLAAWLLRLDVGIAHGRPYHPQTQGKDERLHRTLQTELLRGRRYQNLGHAQRDFDPWRSMYNHERPHEAIGMKVPAQRYSPSKRSLPERLPPLEYGACTLVRKVNAAGRVRLHSRTIAVGDAFAGDPIGVRPTQVDGVYDLLYATFRIGRADLRGVASAGDSMLEV